MSTACWAGTAARRKNHTLGQTDLYFPPARQEPESPFAWSNSSAIVSLCENAAAGCTPLLTHLDFSNALVILTNSSLSDGKELFAVVQSQVSEV